MLQSTLPFIAFQGVFRLPGANLLLSPVALLARVYFHNDLRHNGEAWKAGIQISLAAILNWGAKVCGLAEEFKAAARWIDIASCGVTLSDSVDALAAHISHIYALSLYGTSLETPLQKVPAYDVRRLSQLAKRFFLALANFHLALSGEGSEYLLFANIEFLVRQFRYKKEKFTSQLELLLPGQEVGPAAGQLLSRVYDKTHVTVADRVLSSAKSVLTSMGLSASAASKEEPKPMNASICWTATPAIC